jgi:hypothetical protein
MVHTKGDCEMKPRTLIDQEALELLGKIKTGLGLLFSPRETGAMWTGVALLRDAYRIVCQRNAAAFARILAALRSKDHGAGDGLPQLLRVLGHALGSCARVAAANPTLMLLLVVALLSLYVSYQTYKLPQIV